MSVRCLHVCTILQYCPLDLTIWRGRCNLHPWSRAVFLVGVMFWGWIIHVWEGYLWHLGLPWPPVDSPVLVPVRSTWVCAECVRDCSTWLTVMMAVSRYIAVCHPLHARSFINQRGTRLTIFAVWIGSFAVNLPRFWQYQPETPPCRRLGLDVAAPAGCQCFYYHKSPASLSLNPALASAYKAVWATVAIFIPLVAMIVCNWCLVKALRRSSAMQNRCCRISSTASARLTITDTVGIGSIRNRNDSLFAGPSSLRTPTTAGHRITPTLVALIVLFIVLVGPSEILAFILDYVKTRQVISNITNFNVLVLGRIARTRCIRCGQSLQTE